MLRTLARHPATWLIAVLIPLMQSSADERRTAFTAVGGGIDIEFDSTLYSRVVAKRGGDRLPLGPFGPSEFLTNECTQTAAFKFVSASTSEYRDEVGTGKRSEIIGEAGGMRKTVRMIAYADFPSMLVCEVSYTNTSASTVAITGWVNNHYVLEAPSARNNGIAFWSYQPGSYGWDNDWILPLTPGYSRDNYLGMTRGADYGGGTPVADIWRSDVGVAVGHVELVPRLVSLPVTMPTGTSATLEMAYRNGTDLKPGQTLETFRTFVLIHTGDHFNSLTTYRKFMGRQGITFRDPPEDAYGTEWCGWGYEKDFTMEQFRGTLQKVKELGLDWVVLDMGWYGKLGDFDLPADKFPNGEADMKKLVEEIHAMGLKGQLWWMPLAAEPASKVFTDHFEHLILDENGSPRYMPSFFKSFFLCPASKEVQEHARQQVLRMMQWGWDGLKIDGYNLNMVPACSNPLHKHARPEESCEQLPAFHKMMFEAALSVNPKAKIEICPCGTNQSFFVLPYMNESVASDPHNSWHVRIKGKTLKALTGEKVVYYGDHVELSDNKEDFASTIGVGGTIGTKFVYPPGVHMNKETGDVSLTPGKEARWRKWIGIYKEHMLPKGTYRGELYDLGFDRPEAHAIQKGSAMYYAFFAPSFEGTVELRGLGNRSYTVVDYEQGKTLGTVKGPVGTLNVKFSTHLLLKAE